MRGNTTRWLIVLLTIGLLGALVWWETRPEPIEVAVAEVERGKVEKTVANTRAGTVKACRRAKLSPSLGGQIASLPVREGDPVKQGTLLMELWNKDLVAEVGLAAQEAEAAQATARAACFNADQAKREAQRLKSLIGRKLVSQEDLERAQTQANASAADCEAAKGTAAVSRARHAVVMANLEKTRLVAPFDGVVAEVNGEINEYVTPSPPGIPTLPAVDLIDNGCFYVAAPIDEVDVAGVAVGQPARITLDAFADKGFEGKVRRIADYVLDLEKQARTVEVEVAFSRPEDIEQLLAGYSADVEVILAVRNDTLRIPTEAVLEDDKVYVLHPDTGTVEKRTVRKGTANWDHTEILEGLEAGELVVTTPDKEGLEDGASARRTETET